MSWSSAEKAARDYEGGPLLTEVNSNLNWPSQLEFDSTYRKRILHIRTPKLSVEDGLKINLYCKKLITT